MLFFTNATAVGKLRKVKNKVINSNAIIFIETKITNIMNYEELRGIIYNYSYLIHVILYFKPWKT